MSSCYPLPTQPTGVLSLVAHQAGLDLMDNDAAYQVRPLERDLPSPIGSAPPNPWGASALRLYWSYHPELPFSLIHGPTLETSFIGEQLQGYSASQNAALRILKSLYDLARSQIKDSALDLAWQSWHSERIVDQNGPHYPSNKRFSDTFLMLLEENWFDVNADFQLDLDIIAAVFLHDSLPPDFENKSDLLLEFFAHRRDALALLRSLNYHAANTSRFFNRWREAALAFEIKRLRDFNYPGADLKRTSSLASHIYDLTAKFDATEILQSDANDILGNRENHTDYLDYVELRSNIPDETEFLDNILRGAFGQPDEALRAIELTLRFAPPEDVIFIIENATLLLKHDLPFLADVICKTESLRGKLIAQLIMAKIADPQKIRDEILAGTHHAFGFERSWSLLEILWLAQGESGIDADFVRQLAQCDPWFALPPLLMLHAELSKYGAGMASPTDKLHETVLSCLHDLRVMVTQHTANPMFMNRALSLIHAGTRHEKRAASTMIEWILDETDDMTSEIILTMIESNLEPDWIPTISRIMTTANAETRQRLRIWLKKTAWSLREKGDYINSALALDGYWAGLYSENFAEAQEFLSEFEKLNDTRLRHFIEKLTWHGPLSTEIGSIIDRMKRRLRWQVAARLFPH